MNRATSRKMAKPCLANQRSLKKARGKKNTVPSSVNIHFSHNFVTEMKCIKLKRV